MVVEVVLPVAAFQLHQVATVVQLVLLVGSRAAAVPLPRVVVVHFVAVAALLLESVAEFRIEADLAVFAAAVVELVAVFGI
jgi:hypothetical protein